MQHSRYIYLVRMCLEKIHRRATIPKNCIFAPLSAPMPRTGGRRATKHIKGVESTSYLRLLWTSQIHFQPHGKAMVNVHGSVYSRMGVVFHIHTKRTIQNVRFNIHLAWASALLILGWKAMRRPTEAGWAMSSDSRAFFMLRFGYYSQDSVQGVRGTT